MIESEFSRDPDVLRRRQDALHGVNHDYFAHPLTTETFDRTLEQRAARGDVVSGLVLSDYPGDIAAEANRIMFRSFQDDVDQAIDLQWRQNLRNSLRTQEHPSIDERALRLETATKFLLELKILDQALPLPGLDRIMRQSTTAEQQ